MLSTNPEMNDAALEALVAEYCGRHGKVEAVSIVHEPARDYDAVYALVRMATSASALNVRHTFGDMMYGETSVYIALTPARTREPALA